jgi:hypothetical protein
VLTIPVNRDGEPSPILYPIVEDRQGQVESSDRVPAVFNVLSAEAHAGS